LNKLFTKYKKHLEKKLFAKCQKNTWKETSLMSECFLLSTRQRQKKHLAKHVAIDKEPKSGSDTLTNIFSFFDKISLIAFYSSIGQTTKNKIS